MLTAGTGAPHTESPRPALGNKWSCRLLIQYQLYKLFNIGRVNRLVIVHVGSLKIEAIGGMSCQVAYEVGHVNNVYHTVGIMLLICLHLGFFNFPIFYLNATNAAKMICIV